jgi:hypothetical protein
MRRAEVLSEFSGGRIPFEEFVKRPAWRTLPLAIQLAVLHLRCAEQHPLPAPEIESRSLAAFSSPSAGGISTEDHHPA